MTRRLKWLIPILILCLLLMLVPCTGCTEGELLYLLVYSAICGVQVTIDGEYQGTLGWMEDWGACVLPFVWQEGESLLEFLIPGEKIAHLASAHGMQLTASQASEMPDMTLTYEGVIAHDGRLEIDIYHPIASTTVASTTGLSAQNEDELPRLGSIVVETSSEPFEPRLLVYPTISCEPSSFTVMLKPNTACSNTMRIGNEGDIALSYSISDSGCPWLSETPTSGSVDPGDWEDITITVDASGLAKGGYSAEIVITHNDPDENPTVVPVALLINNPPNALGNPVPANNAAGVPISTDLSWTGGDPDAGDAVAYQVYFGTGPSPPYEATTGPYLASQCLLSYDIGSLAHGTTYYWNILARDNHEVSAIGPLWNFTTASEAGEATATRDLPATVGPGANFDVAIAASNYGSFGQVVETLPGGFTYVSSSLPAGQITVTGNEVRFTLLGQTSFTHTVMAPTVKGTYTFSGILKDADLNEYVVGGDTKVTVGVATAMRDLPDTVDAGAHFNVSITASGYGTFGQAVETLPGGFTYVTSSLPAGQVTLSGSEVKFTLMGETSFTYTIRAASAPGTYTFSGILKDADKNEYAVGGDTIITVGWDAMSYDADGDGEISKSEAIDAVQDYFNGVITKAQAIEVVMLYFG